MARYLLVQVDSNKMAEVLRQKLDRHGGVETIAMFAKPTQFCECGPTDRSLRGKRFGWRLCAQCQLPKKIMHHLDNVMNDPDLPSKFRDMWLCIVEPYKAPLEKYGEKVIERDKQNTADYAAKHTGRGANMDARRAARKRRRDARKEQSRL